MNIDEAYRTLLVAPSDINEHLPMMVDIARQFHEPRIIELGVRGGVSTIAWLYALQQGIGQGHLWSVDVEFPLDGSPIRTLRDVDWRAWTFILGRDDAPMTLAALPSECDIVFIDTAHTLRQTQRELALYAPRVRSGGRIVLHDTLENGVESGFPVRTAIEDFVKQRGLRWTDHPYNNGLGIIEM